MNKFNKDIYEYLELTSYLMVKIGHVTSKIETKAKISIFTTPFQYYNSGPSYANEDEKN